MKTSRLKNIVIVILLLVNAFLLFLLLSRRAGERDSNERRVEQLCTLFEKNGVAFDRALLPDEETHLSLSLERDAAREEAFASALLGTAESSNSGGGVSRFTGEYGSCSSPTPRRSATCCSSRTCVRNRATKKPMDRLDSIRRSRAAELLAATIPRALANSFSKRLATLFSPPSSRMAAAASRAYAAKKAGSSLTPR